MNICLSIVCSGLIPFCLLLFSIGGGLNTPALYAMEPQNTILTTAWDVRERANQLLAELKQHAVSSNNAPTPTALLGRVTHFLLEHGTAIGPSDRSPCYLPYGRIFAEALDRHHLIAAFQASYNKQAQQDFETELSREEENAFLAAWLVTDSAQQRLLERSMTAWDQGDLGEFLYQSSRIRSPDQALLQRRAAAKNMLQEETQALLIPDAIDELGSLWSIPLPRPKVQPQRRNPTDTKLSLSGHNTDSGHIALHTGHVAMLLEPLTGHKQATLHFEPQAISYTEPSNAMTPDHARGRTVYVGTGTTSPRLICINDVGLVLWEKSIPNGGRTPQASNPLILGGTVIVATTSRAPEGTSITISGWELSSGILQWSRLVAKVSTARHIRTQQQAPLLCVHNGRIALLPQDGFLALLGSSGETQALYTFPPQAPNIAPMQPVGQRLQKKRSSRLLSDGTTLVAIVAGKDGVLLLQEGDTALSHWFGDGSNDALLDVKNGYALFGKQTFRLVHLLERRVLWEHKAIHNPNATWGSIGKDTCIISSGELVRTLNRSDGTIIKQLTLPPQTHIVHAGLGLLIGSNNTHVRGFGHAEQFEQKLLATIQNKPNDWHAWASLAGLRAAQDKQESALECYIQALTHNAPHELALQAARHIRTRLDLARGTDSFESALASFIELSRYHMGLVEEVSWWKGRQAEALGNSAEALSYWQSIPTDSSHTVTSGYGLHMNLSLLAQFAQARLQGKNIFKSTPHQKEKKAPTWYHDDCIAMSIPHITSDNKVIIHANGLLRAYDVTTGKELWHQQPSDFDTAMLGIRMKPSSDGGILIEPIPGSSATVAGLRNDDRLIEFNKMAIITGQNLKTQVDAMRIGDAFEAVIKRGNDIMIAKGQLGSWPEQVCSSADGLILSHRLDATFDNGTVSNSLPSFIVDPFIHIWNSADGSMLASYALQPVPLRFSRTLQNTTRYPVPLLTATGIALIPDGANLVAWNPRTNEKVWEQADRWHELQDASFLTDELLLIHDHKEHRLIIRNCITGDLLLSLTLAVDGTVLRQGFDMISQATDGGLQLHDLSTGLLRWNATTSNNAHNSRPIACTSDTVYGIDESGIVRSWHKQNGLLHREYSGWGIVEQHASSHNRLYVEMLQSDGRHALSALSLDSGAISWSHKRPKGLQCFNITAHEGGCSFQVNDEQANEGIIAFNTNGHLLLSQALVGVDALQFLQKTPFSSSLTGVGFPPLFRTTQELETLAVTSIAPDKPWEKELTTHKPIWHQTQQARYSLVRQGDALILIVEHKKGTNITTVLRLSQGIHSLVGRNQAFALRSDGRVLPLNQDMNAWSLVAQATAVTGPNKSLHLTACKLLPTPTHDSAASDCLHVDKLDHPWWLRQNWLKITQTP